MIRWGKKGLIFNVDGNYGWMNSHAQIPTVLVLEDRLRVYFSTREIKTESKTSFLDLDIKNPRNILYVHDKPIIENGKPGCFDEHGVMPSSVMEENGKIYLYYSGWSKRCSVPYNNLTGLAVSEDGGIVFNRIGDGPILSQNIKEPYSATSPFVFRGSAQWHMYYCSGTGWENVDGKYEHLYDIKYANSTDGIHWSQNGKIIIASINKYEAITRPVVLHQNNNYHMWFCYRGTHDFRDGDQAYRIGYASSNDLQHWVRDDSKANISVSRDGWDHKMIAYPYVVKTPYGVYMFYNGNGFGQTGFGYAEMVS